MWAKFKASFANETIIWARIKAVLGMLFLALTSVDLSVFLNPKQVVIWQVFSAFLMMDGGVSEYLRRLKSGKEDDDASTS